MNESRIATNWILFLAWAPLLIFAAAWLGVITGGCVFDPVLPVTLCPADTCAVSDYSTTELINELIDRGVDRLVLDLPEL